MFLSNSKPQTRLGFVLQRLISINRHLADKTPEVARLVTRLDDLLNKMDGVGWVGGCVVGAWGVGGVSGVEVGRGGGGKRRWREEGGVEGVVQERSEENNALMLDLELIKR